MFVKKYEIAKYSVVFSCVQMATNKVAHNITFCAVIKDGVKEIPNNPEMRAQLLMILLQ